LIRLPVISRQVSFVEFSKKITAWAKPIRITGNPDNQRPDKWSSTVFVGVCSFFISISRVFTASRIKKIAICGIGKGKVHPRTRHEGPERE
jgi:hypothetical protein